MEPERHQRLKELFRQVHERPASEREAFAREVCGNDLELLQELLDLLKHDHSRTLVAQHGAAVSDSTSPSQASNLPIAPSVRRRWTVPRFQVAILASAVTVTVTLIAGGVIHQSVTQRMSEHHAAMFRSQCNSTALSVTSLLDTHLTLAETWAFEPELVAAVERANIEDLPAEKRDFATQCPALYANLQRLWGTDVVCVVWNREQMEVLSTIVDPQGIFRPSTESGAQLLNRVLKGESVVYLPNSLETISQGFKPEPGTRVLAFVIPIRLGEGDKVVGAMLIRNRDIEDRFREIFEQSSFLKTGECYAFTPDARMISPPRFRTQLEQLKLLETPADLPSTTYVSLRDPGGDMTEGYRPTIPRDAQPESELVRRSRVEKTGVNMQGYRDYRGRMVVGAWKRIDHFQFGVALELDQEEFREPYEAVNIAFLSAGAFILLVAGWVMSSQIWGWWYGQQLASDPQRVGPYHLERLIGEGGMGKVYRAQHDLLKRPTALKILRPELVSKTAIRRFTREVEFACQLQHPNTVDIYDYGATEDGRFYYAMEYLAGLSLYELVKVFGPLPVPRALYLLRQFCGSLQEAHQAGFVHRDIKPQNIMICNCGGETDFVKVVDFGLVKSSEQQPLESGTSVYEWAGTPRYLAPERLLHPRHVDPRSDIYSIGVTTYWMLTETDPFDGGGVDSLLKAIMSEAPRPFPPELAIPIELQQVILRCLAKVPSERFGSMPELEAALNTVPNPQPWTALQARDWWQAHLPNLMELHPIIHNSDPTPSSSGSGPLSSPQAAVYHTGE